MREPDLQADGWCLDSGEARHAGAPDTFWIPDKKDRENLEVGDIVRLIFQIAVNDPDEPNDSIEVERMWVLVSATVPGGYLGILDNDPFSISENDEFWSGIELPFRACHVIDIQKGEARTRELAAQEPKRRWR